MTDELMIHQAPWQDWYATQDSARGVLLCHRAGEEMVKVEPPPEWGRQWRWNLTEDGSLRLSHLDDARCRTGSPTDKHLPRKRAFPESPRHRLTALMPGADSWQHRKLLVTFVKIDEGYTVAAPLMLGCSSAAAIRWVALPRDLGIERLADIVHHGLGEVHPQFAFFGLLVGESEQVTLRVYPVQVEDAVLHPGRQLASVLGFDGFRQVLQHRRY